MSSTSGTESSSNPVSPLTPDTPTPMSHTNQHGKISFKDLKKQLKEIDKLKREHFDIKSWVSEIRLWIKYQGITDKETIFNACILTSTGEPREVIQDLVEEESDTEDEDHEIQYPSLEQIINKLETFYGTKEDQNLLIRELRALKIKKNEKVKDFNIRYRSLFLKLDKKKRKQISVLDYAESLANNREAWKRVSLKDDIDLEKAFTIAEKVDRLTTRMNSENFDNPYFSNSHLKFKSSNKNHFNHKDHHVGNKKFKKDVDMDDLTKRMKKLTISVCFFCGEEGHYLKICPKLKSKIDANRKKYLEEKHLNH